MIGKRIEVLIDANRRDVAELAAYCEVSGTAAYNWISGKSVPRPAKIEKIASFFSITAQELQYGPILTLSVAPRQLGKTPSKLDLAMSEHAADLMITDELASEAKSAEFRLGMRDMLVYNLSGIRQVKMYQTGTCEADAYDAGNSYAETLIGKIKV